LVAELIIENIDRLASRARPSVRRFAALAAEACVITQWCRTLKTDAHSFFIGKIAGDAKALGAGDAGVLLG
jgi:hypothetical protein